MRKWVWVGLAAVLLALSAEAKDEVKVSDVWTRATAPGQDSGMVQAVIKSKKAATLVGADCDCAEHVELHTMVMTGGVMQMRQVEAIDLPAGEAVDLGAKGYHLMLIGLKQPLQEGKKIKIVLRLRQAEGKESKVKVEARIRGLTDQAGDAHHDMKQEHMDKHEKMDKSGHGDAHGRH